MRINTPFNVLNRTGFLTGGGTMTGPLMLPGHPTADLEAATKNYVDTRITSLNVSDIVSGVFPLARFPAFGGDLRVESGLVNLTPTGVTAGRYVKVVVDGKGRVTGSGGNLLESDIPALSWNKITTGKPTTLAGYGITEALPRSGGTMTGPLLSNVVPHSDLHVINKAQVDSELNGYGLEVGDIIRKAVNETPPGFLRCNGGIVSKTMYSELYKVVEQSYGLVKINTPSKPWKQQNSFATGSLGTDWVEETPFPTVYNHAQILVTKNRVYALAGNSTIVYTTTIDASGVIGEWVLDNPIPTALGYSNLVVTKNRVYLLGGNNSNLCYTAIINSDGTLGDWSKVGNLPSAFPMGETFITTNRVYLVGGGSTVVYTAPISEDGLIGEWTTDNPLPQYTWRSQIVVTKTKVYIVGGSTGTWTSGVNKIFMAPIKTDGTLESWSEVGVLPIVVGNAQIYTNKTHAYLIGGYNNKNVYWAPILPDDSLGEWTVHSELPIDVHIAQIFATKSRLYITESYNSRKTYSTTLTGGKNDYSNYYNGYEITTVVDKRGKFDFTHSSGAGKPWQNQYYINNSKNNATIEVFTNAGVLPVAMCDSHVVVTKNRVYMLGGENSKRTFTTVIDENGKLGSWLETEPLPLITKYGQAIVLNNKVYLISGEYRSSIFSASILENGELGPWVNEITNVPEYGLSSVIVTNSRVYLLGGHLKNGVITSAVYSAPILPEGNIGVWERDGDIPRAVYGSHFTTTRGRVYMFGGLTASGWLGGIPDSYSAPITPEGKIGTWVKISNLPHGYGIGQVVSTTDRIFILGGWTGSGRLNQVYSAKVHLDGTLGVWTQVGTLLYAGERFQTIVTSSRIYILGGVTSGGSHPQIQESSFNGGKDDYSEYYNGETLTLDKRTHFNLPNIVEDHVTKLHSYIKY